MFRLRRYFSIASLFAFVIVTILLGMLYRTVAVRTFIQLEESKNLALTQLFANTLWPEFVPLFAATTPAPVVPPLPPLVTLPGVPLQTAPTNVDRLWHLRGDVVAQMAGLAVIKIKLYDLQGNTIFSTELSQIGENGAANSGFQQALRGEIASELTYRDKFSAFEGVIEKQNVLSTYMAVRPAGPQGEIAAVFELYSNVTPLLQHINSTQWQLMLGVGLILACLYGALFLIVTRADGIIRLQHAAQQTAAAALRQQQQTLVVLQERERLARELHDSLGQVLGYVNAQTQAARMLLAKGKADATDDLLLRLVKVAKNAHVELRDFILQLQTGESSEQGLVERLRLYLQQYQEAYLIQTELVASPAFTALPLPIEAGEQIYRIIQEALNNVYKHAGAQRVTVHCAVVGNEAQISIQDDGQGFDPAQIIPSQQAGLGLRGMLARISTLPGSLEVISQVGQGTTILLRLHQCHATKAAPTQAKPSRPSVAQTSYSMFKRSRGIASSPLSSGELAIPLEHNIY